MSGQDQMHLAWGRDMAFDALLREAIIALSEVAANDALNAEDRIRLGNALLTLEEHRDRIVRRWD